MHTTNIWHKFNLHRRKVAVLFVLIFVVGVNSVFAQLRDRNMNNPNYDNQRPFFVSNSHPFRGDSEGCSRSKLKQVCRSEGGILVSHITIVNL